MKRLATILCALVLAIGAGTGTASAHGLKGPWAGTSIDRTYPISNGYSGAKLPRYVIEALAEWAGLPGHTMYQITEGESAGHPGVDIYDPPGRSRGLYAVNGFYSPEFGATAMRNPILNTLAAAQIAASAGGPNPNIWHGNSHVTGWDLHYHGNPLAIARHLRKEKPEMRLSEHWKVASIAGI